MLQLFFAAILNVGATPFEKNCVPELASGLRARLTHAVPRLLKRPLLWFRLSKATGYVMHLEYTADKSAVVLYRVMGPAEFDQLMRTGEFQSPGARGKGFSFFWRGSVPQALFRPATQSSDPEYAHVVKVMVDTRFFELMTRPGFFDRKGESLTIDDLEISHQDAGVIGNQPPPPRFDPQIDVSRSRFTRRVVDELNLRGNSLRLMNRYIVRIEPWNPPPGQ